MAINEIGATRFRIVSVSVDGSIVNTMPFELEHNQNGFLSVKTLNRLNCEPKQQIKTLIVNRIGYDGNTYPIEFSGVKVRFVREKHISPHPTFWQTLFQFQNVIEKEVVSWKK